MIERNSYFFILIALALCFAGCGSVSNIKTPGKSKLNAIAAYDRVVVEDFNDTTHPNIKDDVKLAMHHDRAKMAGSNFADRIASELDALGIFKEVSRSSMDDPHLVIFGDVVRYAEGNSAARLWIGMGAGSSYFDAIVKFKDGASGEVLGSVTIDKNSWVFGGGIASGQTVEHFMNRGAKRIAEEISETRAVIEEIAPLPLRETAKENL